MTEDCTSDNCKGLSMGPCVPVPFKISFIDDLVHAENLLLDSDTE